MTKLVKARDGFWRRGSSWIRVVELPPENGKRRQRWVSGRTQAEVRSKVKALIASVEMGTYAPPSRVTVADVLDRWLEHAATQVRPGTLYGYRSVASKLKVALGTVPAAQLRADRLTRLYADPGVTPYTGRGMHAVIRQALGHAVRQRILTRNVALDATPPRPRKVEMVTVDADGAAQLLEAARDTDLYTVIALTLATGLRRSEVLGLQWRDLDLDGAELRVERGLHVLTGGKVVYETPKSATSRRVVAMPPSACILLRAHRERMEADVETLGAVLTPETPVFVRPDFTPVRPDHVTKVFARIAKRAGRAGLRFHGLRHSHATLLLAANTHPLIVSRRLGHSTIGITLDLYSHPGMDLQEKAAQAFDAVLATGRAPEQVREPATPAL